jgi:TolC family type I secretion outer membrane protein
MESVMGRVLAGSGMRKQGRSMLRTMAATVLGAVLSCAPAVAQDVPESLPDAITEAIKRNPDIQIAYARRDDARYGVAEARAGFLPRLDVSAGIGPELNKPSATGSDRSERIEASATLRQYVWDFGITSNDVRRARAAYSAADWAARERIELTALEIAQAYVGILERQRQIELGEDNVTSHERILKMVETQKELGLTTGADVSRVQARLESARSALLDRQSELEQARESYRRLTERKPGRAVDLPPVEPALPPSADAAATLIAERSPRLLQSLMERRSLDRQYASQRGNYLPQVGIEVQGSWRDDVLVDVTRRKDLRAVAVVRYNILNGGADRAVANRIAARLREADYQVERVRREVEQDIRNDFTALGAARQKVETLDAEVAAASRVAALYVEQFKSGKRSAFDLLDAQAALFASRATRLTNGTAQTAAALRVLQKLGLLFDHLRSDTGATRERATRN